MPPESSQYIQLLLNDDVLRVVSEIVLFKCQPKMACFTSALVISIL